MSETTPSNPETAHVDTFVVDGLPPKRDWPDLVADGRFVYPERLNAATELLDSAVSRGWGDRPCVGIGDSMWTYSQLLDWSNKIARVLVEDYGLVAGNRVLLRGPNAPWVIAAWFGILKAGCVAVATMPLLREPELRKIYAKCSPSLTLCEAGMEQPLEAVTRGPVACWGSQSTVHDDLSTMADQKLGTFTNVDTAAADPVLLGFTSGTTGSPKATVHFHRDLLIVADAFAPLLKAKSGDIFVGSPPIAFTFGLGGLVVFPMRVGASTIFSQAPGPGPLAALIAKEEATIVFTAPTAYRAMLEVTPPADLSSIRRAVSAGETLPASVFSAFEEATGVRLIDGLGSTEMLHIFLASADEDCRPGATGKPLPGFEGKVVDDAGEEVADGVVGRLAIRGPIGCRYLDDERQRTYVQNGWNLTGDAYMRDRDGYYYYQARTDDMIISSGYNIAAPEVEEALQLHPSVLEAGVVGEPSSERGSVVKAFVHLHDPDMATDDLAEELKAFVKATIAPYKYPRIIVFSVRPLPKTQTGKLQRKALREVG